MRVRGYLVVVLLFCPVLRCPVLRCATARAGTLELTTSDESGEPVVEIVPMRVAHTTPEGTPAPTGTGL